MLDLLKRIACKLTFCCKSKCSMNTEIDIEESEWLEGKIPTLKAKPAKYDYYSKKPKQFDSTRSL